MAFNVPTEPMPGASQHPHNRGRLADGDTCTICGDKATHLKYGRPTCKDHR